MLLDIPTLSGDSLSVELGTGEHIFIIGANGSGKSALIQHFVSSHRNDKIKRITAHRQTAFDSERPTFTHPDRQQFEQQIKNWDLSLDSRWKQDRQFGQQTQLATLTDFIARENTHARLVRNLVRKKDLEAAEKLVQENLSPLERINELFRIANLTATLTLSDDGEIMAQHSDNNSVFRIAHLSDGERSATIMAATVLNVEPNTVLLIDEPERHLHRSIIVPFLSALFEQRQDCSFVISTHEISLPISSPRSRVLVVHRCEWNKSNPTAWDIHEFRASEDLPEGLKLSILGARQRILFVEGEQYSLDQALYGALFPGVLVVSKGSCGEVQRSVKGLRDTESTHHVRAFGLIDADGRSQEETTLLASGGVFALDVFSVESLYYCTDVIASVAERQALARDDDPKRLFEQACNSALNKVGHDVAERMAGRRCERSVRRRALSRMPNWKELVGTHSEFIDISIESTYKAELEEFERLLSARDLEGLVSRYPLRYSEVLHEIARALKCLGRDDYERMAIAQIRADQNLAQKLRGRIEKLSSAIVS